MRIQATDERHYLVEVFYKIFDLTKMTVNYQQTLQLMRICAGSHLMGFNDQHGIVG